MYKNLARVRMSRSKIKDEGHWGAKKLKSALVLHFFESRPRGGALLRRWENQRTLSSLYRAYYELLISRRSGMARVIDRSQFYLPPTRLSTSGSNHTCLYTPQPQSVTALWLALISRPAEGRRLSWPRCLGEILRWFARPKTGHPSQY